MFHTSLQDTDPLIAGAITLEQTRQADQIELIASENIVPLAVMQAQGSLLTNKYAEGYPGRRFYGGCEHVDTVESVAIERGSELVDLWHFRFVDTNGDKIVPVYTKVITTDKVRDEGPWSVFLGKDKFYVRISRMIDIGHEGNAIGQFYLRGDQYAELLNEPAENFEGVHLRDIVRDRYGKPTIGVEERVSAERLPDAVCHWLDLPFFSIGLVCQIAGHTYRRAPLSFQHIFVPANALPLQIRETDPHR